MVEQTRRVQNDLLVVLRQAQSSREETLSTKPICPVVSTLIVSTASSPVLFLLFEKPAQTKLVFPYMAGELETLGHGHPGCLLLSDLRVSVCQSIPHWEGPILSFFICFPLSRSKLSPVFLKACDQKRKENHKFSEKWPAELETSPGRESSYCVSGYRQPVADQNIRDVVYQLIQKILSGTFQQIGTHSLYFRIFWKAMENGVRS